MDEASFQKKVKVYPQGFWHKSGSWKQSKNLVRLKGGDPYFAFATIKILPESC